MNFSVPSDVIKQTTRCPENFSCITNQTGQGKCKVMFVSDAKLILKGKTNKTCPYHETYDYGNLCTCPTLYALHIKYGHHRK